MRNKIITLIAGIIAGVLFAGVAMMSIMPKMMLHEKESPLGYQETIAHLENVITNNGWIISRKIDLQKSISQYGKTIPQVTIIKICQADYAEKILNTDEAMYVSVMMPCSMAVYQKSDGKTYVSTMNTGLMGKMFGGVVAEVMGGPVAADEAEFTAFLHQ
ncbi:MAG: DUF302 domain-containing protein [Kiritimatiellales bacterium]|nr:DUF302 domain-containing protein [Kiritimatiellota bacterium]MBL7012097.1 DUF302 domain-containing protein [Kiritimatiellales bacterium]